MIDLTAVTAYGVLIGLVGYGFGRWDQRRADVKPDACPYGNACITCHPMNPTGTAITLSHMSWVSAPPVPSFFYPEKGIE